MAAARQTLANTLNLLGIEAPEVDVSKIWLAEALQIFLAKSFDKENIFMTPIRTLIMGAAGRDFHNFNVFFRDNPDYEVVAFTATQIPDIEGRTYPAELAGTLYPKGIPIYAES